MYCTEADLITRFGSEITELADRDGDNSADAGVIDNAISDASALIDGYLSSRYSVPVSPAPVLIVGLACDISRRKLFTDRAPEQVQRAFDSALSVLRDNANGRGNIDAAKADATTPSSGSFAVSAPDRVFSDSALTGF